MTEAQQQPVAARERAQILDVLRGFALLGILVSHVPTFSGYEFLEPAHQAPLDIWKTDGIVRDLTSFFVRGKFYSLFSLLFGIGFSIQIGRATERSRDVTRRFARRMGLLLLIGIAHSLIWFGDILIYYSLLGLLLLPMAGWNAQRTLRASMLGLSIRLVWGLLVLAAVPLFVALLPDSVADSSEQSGAAGVFLGFTQSFASSSPQESFAANTEFLKLKALQMIYDGKIISVFSMFLLGAWIGKKAIFRDLRGHRRLLLRVFAVCAPIGLVGNAILVPLHAATPVFPPTLQRAMENAVFSLSVPALALAYASGLSLLSMAPTLGRGLRWLSAPGRMALTVYLSHTLILQALFYGWGFGWMWRIGQTQCLQLALLIFAVQVVLAALWLRHFRYGPVEWLWRCGTYGTWLPLRHA